MPTPLRHLSPQHLAYLLRQAKIYDADWTVNDVLWALCNRPDEGPWQLGHDVRHVAGWVAFRLAAHSGVDGRPVASKSQRDEAYRDRMAAEAVATAAQIAADAAFREAAKQQPAGPGQQSVREMLAEMRQRRALGLKK